MLITKDKTLWWLLSHEPAPVMVIETTALEEVRRDETRRDEKTSWMEWMGKIWHNKDNNINVTPSPNPRMKKAVNGRKRR